MAIYKDRIDIYNPGLFPQGVAPEDFLSGDKQSLLRNPLIAETMYKSKDIERWGSGIKRIHDECVAAGIRVEFHRRKTGFVVSFYRPKWEEGEGLTAKGQKSMVKSKGKILEMISQAPSVTIPEMAKVLEMSAPVVEKIIRVLKKEDRLRRVGPDKGGHWEVSGGFNGKDTSDV